MQPLPPLFETPRLLLRELRPGHGAALHTLYRDNRDRLAASFPGAVAQVVDAGGGEAYIQSKTADRLAGKAFWYGIWMREQALLIQIKHVDRDLQKAELAYLVDRAHEGKGLISEAARRILRVCFEELGLYKVFLRTVVGNARSEALARHLGFKLEGTLRGEFLAAGTERVDVNYFGLLASETAGLRRDVP